MVPINNSCEINKDILSQGNILYIDENKSYGDSLSTILENSVNSLKTLNSFKLFENNLKLYLENIDLVLFANDSSLQSSLDLLSELSLQTEVPIILVDNPSHFKIDLKQEYISKIINECNVSYFISKPINTQELLYYMSNILSQKYSDRSIEPIKIKTKGKNMFDITILKQAKICYIEVDNAIGESVGTLLKKGVKGLSYFDNYPSFRNNMNNGLLKDIDLIIFTIDDNVKQRIKLLEDINSNIDVPIIVIGLDSNLNIILKEDDISKLINYPKIKHYMYKPINVTELFQKMTEILSEKYKNISIKSIGYDFSDDIYSGDEIEFKTYNEITKDNCWEGGTDRLYIKQKFEKDIGNFALSQLFVDYVLGKKFEVANIITDKEARVYYIFKVKDFGNNTDIDINLSSMLNYDLLKILTKKHIVKAKRIDCCNVIN